MSGLEIWECPTQPNATKLFQTVEAKVNAMVTIKKSYICDDIVKRNRSSKLCKYNCTQVIFA